MKFTLLLMSGKIYLLFKGDSQMKSRNFKLQLFFFLTLFLCVILTKSKECYAETTTKITIGERISNTTFLMQNQKYTFSLKEKTKLTIYVSVDEYLDTDNEENCIVFDLYNDKYNHYIDYWEILEGEKQTETVELEKGNYTIRIFGDTEDLEFLDYSFSTKNVTKYANQITIPESVAIIEGSSKKIKADWLPKGSYSGKITWSTSNEKIATVSTNGTVKAISAGECTIKATLSSGNIAKCKVKITPLYATKISATEKLSIYTSDSKTINVKVREGGKKVNTITWSSSNNKVAKVNEKGMVTGVKAGTCTVTGILKGGNTVKCVVTVKGRPQLYITEASFDINFVGGIEPYFTLQNNFGKTIKYIYLNCYFYNRVGDPAYCEIKDTYFQRLKITGPIKDGITNTYYWDAVIYNNTTGKMYLKSAEIEFMDGTKKTISLGESYK